MRKKKNRNKKKIKKKKNFYPIFFLQRNKYFNKNLKVFNIYYY